jgi:transmembrane 9 superfamily protein 2/4
MEAALRALIFVHGVNCIFGYLPGIAPVDYDSGESVDLKVNKLTSTHTQIPYDYYKLKFCRPQDGIKAYSENLGELLSGDRIENSPYDVKMLKEESCRILCQVKYSKEDAKEFKTMVKSQYHNNWIIDNLPAASILDTDLTQVTSYTGFPVGFVKDSVEYLYNHVNLILDYHEAAPNTYRVVGFAVQPFSIDHHFTSEWNGQGTPPTLTTCSKKVDYENVKGNKFKIDSKGGTVVYTYGVTWQESDVTWASRWDVYLKMSESAEEDVRWFSIINSFLIVLFLATMVGMILLRTLNREITRYNAIPTAEEKAEEQEETGWKLVHADVFRAPTEYPMMFCVMVGTGMQIAIASSTSLFFAALGYVTPQYRGSILLCTLSLFVLTSSVTGFVSAVLYKTFKGKQWQKCTTVSALAFPGLCFGTFFILNFLMWCYGSTEAVPFLTMIGIILLWLGISAPMTFLGAYMGYRIEPIDFPVVTSNIPRQIPEGEWFHHPLYCAVVAGLLPFGACFVELYFVMSSIWMDQYYYLFGFLLIVVGILAFTCAEVAVVLTYFQLVNEDYRWWWRSFISAGFTAVYIFLYSIFYFLQLETSMAVTYVLYFGYMGLISIAIFLALGSVGFLSSLQFIKTIYASIKVD